MAFVFSLGADRGYEIDSFRGSVRLFSLLPRQYQAASGSLGGGVNVCGGGRVLETFLEDFFYGYRGRELRDVLVIWVFEDVVENL